MEVSKRFQEIEKEAKVGYINFAVLKLEETEIQAVTTFTQFGG